MSGGSAEGALAMAACAQMANYYGLPNSTIAGATDSKLADAQSGYEKSLGITLAAQAGSNLVTQAAGMQGSLMGCALESYVIDNDMLGGIMRSLVGIEVSDETLALEAIDQVVHGLGQTAGVEHEHPGVRVDPVQHVEHDHPLAGTEGSREGDTRMKILDSPSQDFLGTQGLGFAGGDEPQDGVRKDFLGQLGQWTTPLRFQPYPFRSRKGPSRRSRGWLAAGRRHLLEAVDLARSLRG